MEGPMSPFAGMMPGHRDLEDLLGVGTADLDGSMGSESPGGKEFKGSTSLSTNGRLGTPALGGASPSLGLVGGNSIGILSDAIPATASAASGSMDVESGPQQTFLAATLQQHQHLRSDPSKPLTPSEIQRLTWSDFFRVIKSLQFHLQTLSVLGTRARVKPLALRSKRVLVGLLEETDKPGRGNHFSTVLLADCGLSGLGGPGGPA